MNIDAIAIVREDSGRAIARTIMEQIGGQRMRAMTGAKDFVSLGDGVQFGLPRRARNGANKIVIKLMPTDTYKVEFWYCGRAALVNKLISAHNMIYGDLLKSLLVMETGLAFSL